jgi:hypothetical protein
MASVGLTTFASQIVLWLPLLGMFTGFLNTGVALILVAINLKNASGDHANSRPRATDTGNHDNIINRF